MTMCDNDHATMKQHTEICRIENLKLGKLHIHLINRLISSIHHGQSIGDPIRPPLSIYE